MGILAWVFGSIGALCAVMGILAAVGGVVPQVGGPAFTPMFWLTLSGVILIISLIFAVSRGGYD